MSDREQSVSEGEAIFSCRADAREIISLAPRRATRARLGVTFFAVAFSFFGGSAKAQDGLIAHLDFKHTSGDVIRDLSGAGNDGLLAPSDAAPRVIQRSGPFTGSVWFAGHSDHFVRLPASQSLNTIRHGISVLALIYPQSLWRPPSLLERLTSGVARRLAGVAHAIGVSAGGQTKAAPPETGFAAVVQRQWRTAGHPDQFFLGYGPANNVLNYKWHIGLMDGADVSIYQLPPGQERPVAEELVHLAGTYDGVSGRMSLYVNAQLIGSTTHPGEIRLDEESLSRPVAIGGELNGPSEEKVDGEFKGYIYDVQIFDRALSPEEIRVRFEQSKASTPVIK